MACGIWFTGYDSQNEDLRQSIRRNKNDERHADIPSF